MFTCRVISILAIYTVVNALNFFGVNYNNEGNPYGQWVVMSPDGTFAVGKPSNTYSQSSGTCGNAFNGSAYVVNDGNGYQTVDESGTTGEVTFSVMFQVVSWCYSSRLRKYVGVGWDIGSVLVETKTHVYSLAGNGPVIFGVDANDARNVSVLVSSLAGGAFLKCACAINDNGINDTTQFVYSYLNPEMTQQYIGIQDLHNKSNHFSTVFDINSQGVTFGFGPISNSTVVFVLANSAPPLVWAVDVRSGVQQTMTGFDPEYVSVQLSAVVLDQDVLSVGLQDVNSTNYVGWYNVTSNTTSYTQINGSTLSLVAIGNFN